MDEKIPSTATWNDGVQASADLLQAKADELRALDNLTAITIARVLEEQKDAILKLKK